MIIGAGMFGIPFSFARAGFWLGTAELVVLAGATLLIHTLYGEVVLKTGEYHRLPGYVAVYLGDRAKILARASAIFGLSGTLLAYVILGAVFLNAIFKNVWGGPGELGWAVAIMIAGAGVNLFPLKREALLNGILTALLIGFIIVLIFLLFPGASLENIGGWDVKNIFLPYGILLFALSGGAVVPEVVTLLGKDRTRVRGAIFLGTLMPAVLYFFFALAVVGVAGAGVSSEAISSLLPFVGDRVVLLGSVIGFLAVFTSFIVLNSNFQAMLTLDFGFRPSRAWAAVSLIPPLLYFFGFQNFIVVIGAVGALGVGVDMALLIAVYHKIQKIAGIVSARSYLWKFLLYTMIAAGAVYALYDSMAYRFF